MVKNCNDKAFDVDILGKAVTVSTERLKSAFVLTDDKNLGEQWRLPLSNNKKDIINNKRYVDVNDENEENAKKAFSPLPLTTTRYGKGVRFNLKQT